MKNKIKNTFKKLSIAGISFLAGLIIFVGVLYVNAAFNDVKTSSDQLTSSDWNSMADQVQAWQRGTGTDATYGTDDDVVSLTSGQLGIGTTNPTAKLDVAGDIKTSEGVTVGNSASTDAGTIRWNGTTFEGFDGTTWAGLGGGGSSVWSESGSDIYYNSGNIGVGTDTPTHTLDIFSDLGNAEIALKSPGATNHWGIYQNEATEDLRFWHGDDKLILTDAGIDVNNGKITNVATPTDDNDAVNKAYIDLEIQKLRDDIINEFDPLSDPDYSIFFVTDSTYDGNLGGRAGADAKCQQAATNAGLTGDNWAAFISTKNVDPYTILPDPNIGYINTIGEILATTKTGFLSGETEHLPAFIRNEYGLVLTGDDTTFTGLTYFNNKVIDKYDDNCESWTNAVINDCNKGQANATLKDEIWTSGGASICDCSLGYHIYCFSY